MENHLIQIEESAQKGYAYIGAVDQPEAAMMFTKAGDELIIINHTEIQDSSKGQGIGRQLLQTVVDLARERGAEILPLCPYARSRFQKDPAIRDVLRGG